MVVPEVVATSRRRIKSPLPVYCGFQFVKLSCVWPGPEPAAVKYAVPIFGGHVIFGESSISQVGFDRLNKSALILVIVALTAGLVFEDVDHFFSVEIHGSFLGHERVERMTGFAPA